MALERVKKWEMQAGEFCENVTIGKFLPREQKGFFFSFIIELSYCCTKKELSSPQSFFSRTGRVPETHSPEMKFSQQMD